jgi:metallo-beta-lactamase class B
MVLALAASAAALAAADVTPAPPDQNRPVPPFRIAGTVYYVGGNEVTSFLFVTKDGLVLLDSGFAETVPQIEKNVRALGFDPKEIRLLLNSQAHFDHAAGLAELKRKTGAKLVASAGDKPQLEDGGRHDPAFGSKYPFEPVTVDRVVADGEKVTLGGVALVARVTPGHTRGCTTWTTRVDDGGTPRDVVFLCSVSSPGYKLVGNAEYPEIADDLRRSLRVLREMPCDILLGSHASFFGLEEKRAALAKGGGPNPFVDSGALKRFVDARIPELEKEIAAQKGESR